jgi:hypothetical protein
MYMVLLNQIGVWLIKSALSWLVAVQIIWSCLIEQAGITETGNRANLICTVEREVLSVTSIVAKTGFLVIKKMEVGLIGTAPVVMRIFSEIHKGAVMILVTHMSGRAEAQALYGARCLVLAMG